MEPNFDADRVDLGFIAAPTLIRPYVAALQGQAAHRVALLDAWDSVALPEGPADRAGSHGRVGACPARHSGPSRLRRPLLVAGLGVVLCAVGFTLPAVGAGEPASTLAPDPAGVAAPAQGYLTTAVSPSAEPVPESAPTSAGATRAVPALNSATSSGAAPDPTTPPGTTAPGRVRRPAVSSAPGASDVAAPAAAGAPDGTGPAPQVSATPSAAGSAQDPTGLCVDLLGITVGLGDC